MLHVLRQRNVVTVNIYWIPQQLAQTVYDWSNIITIQLGHIFYQLKSIKQKMRIKLAFQLPDLSSNRFPGNFSIFLNQIIYAFRHHIKRLCNHPKLIVSFNFHVTLKITILNLLQSSNNFANRLHLTICRTHSPWITKPAGNHNNQKQSKTFKNQSQNHPPYWRKSKNYQTIIIKANRTGSLKIPVFLKFKKPAGKQNFRLYRIKTSRKNRTRSKANIIVPVQNKNRRFLFQHMKVKKIPGNWKNCKTIFYPPANQKIPMKKSRTNLSRRLIKLVCNAPVFPRIRRNKWNKHGRRRRYSLKITVK